MGRRSRFARFRSTSRLVFAFAAAVLVGSCLPGDEAACHCDFGRFCVEFHNACDAPSGHVNCSGAVPTAGACRTENVIGECGCTFWTEIYYSSDYTTDEARSQCSLESSCSFSAR